MVLKWDKTKHFDLIVYEHDEHLFQILKYPDRKKPSELLFAYDYLVGVGNIMELRKIANDLHNKFVVKKGLSCVMILSIAEWIFIINALSAVDGDPHATGVEKLREKISRRVAKKVQ